MQAKLGQGVDVLAGGQLVAGGQHEVGLGRDDRLAIDRAEADDDGQVGDGGRHVIGIADLVLRDADQAVTRAQRADDLGVRRRQADDALRLGVQGHLAPGVIGQGEGVDGGRLRRGRRRQRRRAARAGGRARAGSELRAGSDQQGQDEGWNETEMPPGAHGDAFPFTRGFGHRDLAGRPGSRTVRSGYSCGTAPALHRLRHSSAGLSAAAPVAVFSWWRRS